MVQKKNSSKGKIGAGLAVGAAAALAGYYFYADKDAKSHRKMAARWADALKKDVMKEVKVMKKIDKAAVMNAVDKVSKFYQESGDAKKADIMRAARELKDHWTYLQKEVGGAASKVSRTIKKTAKKVSKK